jgi:Ran GTPase-activating protein (RanGAP) involved in mRNA processing and transport
MILLGMMSYPPENSREIGKRFKESFAVPAYMTLKGPYVYPEGGVIKVIALYEFDQSRLKEAEDDVLGRFEKYSGVQGFTSSVQTCLEIKEAFQLIGLG